MSKKDKLEQRLRANPQPKDFKWDDFVTLMRQNGFKESCRGGSHFMFMHTSGLKFRASRSHPEGVLKGYQIEEAIKTLDIVRAEGLKNG